METHVQQKRYRVDEANESDPSPVIHVRGLPSHTLEIDLVRLFETFGVVREATMLPQRRQALVEFLSTSTAQACVDSASRSPLRINEQEIQVTFSTSRRIIQRAGDKSPQDLVSETMENHVLLYTIFNVCHPVTIDVIRQVTMPYGTVVRIVMFRKTQLQAMVEMKTIDEARQVKRNISGADIFSDCCTLKVDYARPTRLTVLRNDADSWDYEKTGPALLDVYPTNGHRTSGSLLGCYRDHSQPQAQQPLGTDAYLYYPSPLNRCLIDRPQESELSTSHSQTSVAMMYNLDKERMNCDRLFNLLCPYGHVVRIKFLLSNEGCAMVQMGDTQSVDRLITHLSGCTLIGRPLLIRPSKQISIMDVPHPFDLPDGSPSFKDFSQSINNRYSPSQPIAKNRSLKPSMALHYWNCPLSFCLDDIRAICAELDVPSPTEMIPYSKNNGRTSSGLIQWDKESDALMALTILNHHTIATHELPQSFTLKLSFASDLNPSHGR
ncbi:unnamed protein product [Dicrocoelium dendriticum]|nr:unnamed protein product [Dicrocoelium dendriticum]